MIVAMLWFKRQPILRGPSPEAPWPERETRCPGYAVTVRRQSHSTLPGNVSRPPRPLAYFQGIKFRRLWARQDLLDCPAERLLLVNTKYGRAELTSKAEEGPSRFADFSIQSAPIEILDQSPARHTGLTFESQGFRQECAILDQDGPRLDGVWHWGSPRRLSWRIVLQKAHL